MCEIANATITLTYYVMILGWNYWHATRTLIV